MSEKANELNLSIPVNLLAYRLGVATAIEKCASDANFASESERQALLQLLDPIDRALLAAAREASRLPN